MSDGEYLKRPSQTLPSLSSLRNSLRDLTRRRHSEPEERSKRIKRKEQKPKEKTKSSLAKKLGLSRYRNQVKPISRPSPMSSQSSDEEIQVTAEELYDQPPGSSKASGDKELEEERNPSPKSVRFEEDDVVDPVEKIVCSSPVKNSDSPDSLKMEHPLQMENPLSPEEPKSTKEILAELSKVSNPMAFEIPVNKIQETTASRPPRPLSLEGAQQGLALEKREHLYKILVIGELGAGKTSIIKRYVHQFFSQHYRATIGVDFALKVLNWDSSTVIRLQLWDIAGQERFGNMTRVYYKEAVGAFVVFDVTRVATFDAVLKWKQDLDSKVQLPDGSSIPCVLLANKCDQQKEGLVNSPNKMEEYCKDRGFSGWFETSAKENVNIEEAARFLVNKILQNDQILQAANNDQRDGDKFSLDGSKKGGNNSGSRESSRKGMCSSC